ncbi:hypothetical protein [Cognatilysobacter tabacisoli]|uniref:hypothetical protein n=1 Tax=Cognatilysobacter tabacisoli TaxID=2315424 RepID=UPI000E6B2545|nr:hypothetical protein [Lysobacter tabacisoli]
MNLTTTFALALAVAAVTLPAGADPARDGALAVPANRIVGAWDGTGLVQPCGSGLPFRTVRNTIVFQAGGIVVENARFPPNGVPNVQGVPGITQRSIGLGTWSYNPATGQYAMQLRFDYFVDGAYHGYGVVERTILLSNDGTQNAGPVRAVRYRPDGSIVAEECGTGSGVRIQ